jgi:hypothetical protein
MSGNILAMSDPQPIAEWTSRYQGYHPQFTGSASNATWVPRVDKYARRVRDRWMYVLMETQDTPHDFLVAFEICIDSDCNAFYCRRDESVGPASPIPARGDPLLVEGASGQSVSLPMTDDRGRALVVRLLLSRFRLPSTAIRELRQQKLRAELRRRIAPLWEWKAGRDDAAPLQSRDGFSLVPTPLWMDLHGEEMRVWVGGDPFEIAVNRSEAYCAARQRYSTEYEPTSERQQRERSRLMLAQVIDSAILRNEPVRERYGKFVAIARINEVLEADEQRRRKAVRRFETAGAALCQVLDSTLFRLYQEASLSEEGIAKDDRSEPLSEHLEVLGLASRMLGQCRSGQALLAMWAEEAEQQDDHFVNRVVLPTKDPPVSHFKAFRWGSKALATVLAELVSHRVRVLRVAPKVAVGEMIGMLGRLGVGGAYDPVSQITDIRKLSGEYTRHGNLNLEMFAVEVKAGPLQRPHTIEFAYAAPEIERALQEWTDAGAVLDRGRTKKLLDARFAGALVLDVLNLGLSIKAAAETKDGAKRVRAMLDSGVAGVSVLVNLADHGVSKGWLTLHAHHRAQGMKLAFVLRCAVSGYYGFTNALDAVDAFRSGDNDRGYALSIATAAEMAAVAGHIWAALAPGSLVAPWFVVAAGVVAASAYIAATYLKDDPLEKFLTNCEWGADPYGDPDLAPRWADAKVASWKGDFSGQARTLTRVLLRLTTSWDLRQWPAVTVSWSAHDPSARVEVEFVADLVSGASLRESFVAEDDGLPRRAPFEVRAKPKRIHVNVPGIRRMRALVSYRHGFGGEEEETLECLLMEDGHGITSGEVTRVS